MKQLRALFDAFWLPIFLLLAVSWLFGPLVHHARLNTLQVISHYEAVDQAWSWLFRLCDVLAAVVLALAVWRYAIVRLHRPVGVLLYVVAALAAVDAIFPLGCPGACTQLNTMSHGIHDAESAVGAIVVGVLTIWELTRRRHWFTVVFLGAQIASALLAVSGAVPHNALVALQFGYEVLMLVWLSWVIMKFAPPAPQVSRRVQLFIRRTYGTFTLLSGIFAILVAIPHRHLWGPFLDFSVRSNGILLAQHSVVAGALLLYISRHVSKGQRRAAGLLVLILVTQVFRYALLQPHFGLLAANLVALLVLIWLRGAFTRNTMSASPLLSRLKDMGVVLLGIGVALGVIVLVSLGLGKQRVLYTSVARAYHHNTVLLKQGERRLPERHERELRAALDALVFTVLALALWSLFRPSGWHAAISDDDKRRVMELLARYANSSDDFFKVWPEGKQYYFNRTGSGFVAYKTVGGLAFAIADPIAPAVVQRRLMSEFIDFCHSHGWSACFLLVRDSSRRIYEHGPSNLKLLQIGSSAVISVPHFVGVTQREKWWRWQLNRAERLGFTHQTASPPHAPGLVAELRRVSDAWLQREGHTERGFMLGYFDDAYLQQCTVHVLRDADARLIAFANELPIYNSLPQSTVDLIRFVPDVDGAMPVLLSHLLQQLHERGVASFDLGFVPLAGLDSAFATMAKRLAKDRFSAAGLEQFKGKFRPEWQANYIAYDGDIVDLARVLATIDNVFKLPPSAFPSPEVKK